MLYSNFNKEEILWSPWNFQYSDVWQVFGLWLQPQTHIILIFQNGIIPLSTPFSTFLFIRQVHFGQNFLWIQKLWIQICWKLINFFNFSKLFFFFFSLNYYHHFVLINFPSTRPTILLLSFAKTSSKKFRKQTSCRHYQLKPASSNYCKMLYRLTLKTFLESLLFSRYLNFGYSGFWIDFPSQLCPLKYH